MFTVQTTENGFLMMYRAVLFLLCSLQVSFDSAIIHHFKHVMPRDRI